MNAKVQGLCIYIIGLHVCRYLPQMSHILIKWTRFYADFLELNTNYGKLHFSEKKVEAVPFQILYYTVYFTGVLFSQILRVSLRKNFHSNNVTIHCNENITNIAKLDSCVLNDLV